MGKATTGFGRRQRFADRRGADETVRLHGPRALDGVGRWYEDFSQVSDQEVLRLLGRARIRSDRNGR